MSDTNQNVVSKASTAAADAAAKPSLHDLLQQLSTALDERAAASTAGNFELPGDLPPLGAFTADVQLLATKDGKTVSVGTVEDLMVLVVTVLLAVARSSGAAQAAA